MAIAVMIRRRFPGVFTRVNQPTSLFTIRPILPSLQADIPTRLTFTVISDGGPNLFKFKLHQWILVVTISVVVREDPQAFCFLALRDEPPWALGCQEDKEELNGGWDALDDGRDAPRPFIWYVSSAICYP